VILDTSVVIAAERRTIRFEAFLGSLGDEPIAIAAVTAAELLHGCHRGASPAIRARRYAFVEGVLGAVLVLTYGVPEARRHAELGAELERKGALIGPYDMVIGATALARGYALATLNTEEFGRVPGLLLAPLTDFLS